jgi:protein-S-isoprenylcysteine O-methyltransferase Ste14
MQSYLGFALILLFACIVAGRSLVLKSRGIDSVEFGGKDKKDFLLLPFALFYFYLIAAHTFGWPTVPGEELFRNKLIAWLGVLSCVAAAVFFIWTMVSFKESFRVGLSENTEQGLITNGAFALSRNPIYVSFALMLIGEFLIFGSWIMLVYIVLGFTAFHRQVLKEEVFLREQYGEDFENYCRKVRRYL